MRDRVTRILFAAALLTAALAGCRQPPPSTPEPAPPAGAHLHAIGLAYDAATNTLGRPPHSLDDLRPALAAFGDPDQLLVSPVDDRPYVILWDVDLREAGPGTVLAYEQAGADGRRYVLLASGVTQLTDAELAAAEFPPGHRPPAGP